MKVFFLSILLLPFLTFGKPMMVFEEKPTIAVLPFQYGPNVSKADADAIAQKVESAFINSKRFTVIERTNFSQIFQELDAQRSEIYINSSHLADQGMLIGASQIVVGNISTTGPEGTTFNIKVVDVSSGETIGAKDISDQSNRKKAKIGLTAINILMDKNKSIGDAEPSQSTSNMIGGALLNISKEIEEFINATYALTFELIEIATLKGDQPIEILILGGVMEGCKESLNLEVISESVRELRGKTIKQKKVVGKIKVTSVEGDVSLCKIISGGKEIMSMLNEKESLYASTIISK